MKYQDFALKTLKSNKCRITNSRKTVLEILAENHSPLNPYQISEIAFKRGFSIDTSTIYRIIEVLKKHQLVHFIKESQGYTKCQKTTCTKSHCHHQFICKKCQNITEVHFEDHKFFADIQKQFNHLTINSHYIELSGLCSTCK